MDALLNSLKESLDFYGKACDEATDEHAAHILHRIRAERARQLHDVQRAVSILGKPKQSATMQSPEEPRSEENDVPTVWMGCALRDSRTVSLIRNSLNDPLVHPGLKALLDGIQLHTCMDLELLSLQRGHPICKAA